MTADTCPTCARDVVVDHKLSKPPRQRWIHRATGKAYSEAIAPHVVITPQYAIGGDR